jgi:hypothetical protein
MSFTCVVVMPRVRRDHYYNHVLLLKGVELWDYPFAKLSEDWVEVTLQSFEHGGPGLTKAQKDVGEIVVGQELRMNVKKGVFGGWLQLTRLKQLGRWGILEGLFWKDRCLCEQFIAESVRMA